MLAGPIAEILAGMELAQALVVVVGGIMLVTGVIFAAASTAGAENRARRRLRQARPTPIHEIAPGEEVLVSGTARPGPRGVVHGSLSGEPALLYRSAAMTRYSGDQTHLWRTRHREGDQAPFWIEDDTGTILCHTDDVRLVLEETYVTSGRDEWLRERIGYTTGGVRYIEKRIDAEQRVSAVGVAARERGPDGFREIVSLGSTGPVLLTTLAPEEAVNQLGTNVRGGIGLAIAGVVVAAVGVALGLAW